VDAGSIDLIINQFMKMNYMKPIVFTLALCLFMSAAFTQNEKLKEIPAIEVPDFADAGVKSFYRSYADHLIKCIKAIREKNEAKAKALFKDPGEQLVTREKIIAKELVKKADEKQKYARFAADVYPYIKEVERSEYYIKMYKK
jgi:hypothetical protein